MHQEDQILSQQNRAPVGGAEPGSAAATGRDEAASKDLLAHILQSLEDDKAVDVVSIDLRGRTEMADYMVIATGRSSRQVTSIAAKLADRLKEALNVRTRTEGTEQGDWVLVDCGDVVVHVFRPEVREFYQIEKMWMATPRSTGRG